MLKKSDKSNGYDLVINKMANYVIRYENSNGVDLARRANLFFEHNPNWEGGFCNSGVAGLAEIMQSRWSSGITATELKDVSKLVTKKRLEIKKDSTT